jgi:hypothetical protein
MALPMVIVHRGGEAHAPENTLAAFAHTAATAARSAVAAAARGEEAPQWWVETDLRAAATGELAWPGTGPPRCPRCSALRLY